MELDQHTTNLLVMFLFMIVFYKIGGLLEDHNHALTTFTSKAMYWLSMFSGFLMVGLTA